MPRSNSKVSPLMRFIGPMSEEMGEAYCTAIAASPLNDIRVSFGRVRPDPRGDPIFTDEQFARFPAQDRTGLACCRRLRCHCGFAKTTGATTLSMRFMSF